MKIPLPTVNGRKPTREELKIIREHERKSHERQLANALAESVSRGRSISVGTAFGGTTELSMRRADNTTIYVLLQQVEIVELIHQLAANIGCHINLQPRNDFASWRQWKSVVEDPAGKQTTMQELEARNPILARKWKDEQQQQTVATPETVGRKRTKRAANPA
jgi:hypothetical protein